MQTRSSFGRAGASHQRYATAAARGGMSTQITAEIQWDSKVSLLPSR